LAGNQLLDALLSTENVDAELLAKAEPARR